MIQSLSLFVKNFSIGTARAALLPALPLDRGPFSPSEIAMGDDWKFVGEALSSVIPKEAYTQQAALKEYEPEHEGDVEPLPLSEGEDEIPFEGDDSRD